MSYHLIGYCKIAFDSKANEIKIHENVVHIVVQDVMLVANLMVYMLVLTSVDCW